MNKLNPTTKRHIKLLAERFEHDIHYDRHVICLSNSKNSIRIEENRDRMLEVTYNIESWDEITTNVTSKELYDLLIKILTRYEVEEVELKSGKPIQIEEWLETEFRKNSRIIDLKRYIQKEKSEHVFLGGNRLEAEYFKGILILIDDILVSPFNVVDFPLDE